MYATIRSYAGSRDFADALLAKQDEVRALLTGIDGFRAYYLVRTGEGTTTISVYDDQAGAEESTRAATAWVGENLADVSPGAPEVTTGEVAFSL